MRLVWLLIMSCCGHCVDVWLVAYCLTLCTAAMSLRKYEWLSI